MSRRTPDPKRAFDFAACERVMAGEWEPLSVQERRYVVDVLHRQGLGNRAIGETLHIGHRTVERILATGSDVVAVDDQAVIWPGDTRDQLAEWAAQEALRLTTDVHDLDPRDIWIRLSHLPRVELQAVVVALAAIVPTDRTARELLAPIEHLGAA